MGEWCHVTPDSRVDQSPVSKEKSSFHNALQLCSFYNTIGSAPSNCKSKFYFREKLLTDHEETEHPSFPRDPEILQRLFVSKVLLEES